jgi:hypothetical protein
VIGGQRRFEDGYPLTGLARFSKNRPMFRGAKRRDVTAMVALVAVIAVVWCVVNHRLTVEDWAVPLSASSDGLDILAAIKAAAEGHFHLIQFKLNPELGAPHSANWNDMPMTEEILFVVAGLLTQAVGLFAASNLMALFGHIAAGVGFFLVCRHMRYRWQWSLLGSFVFALSHYAFRRSLPHLGLTYFWHIPLCLLVIWWCASRRGLKPGSRRFWIALAVAFITGIQNPYYTNIFLQFLGLTVLAQLLRRAGWRKYAAPLLLGATAMVGFVSMNLDTLFYQWVHGPNPQPAQRSYANLEVFALKPIDLVIPPADHRSDEARAFAARYVYDDHYKTSIRGETFFPYLGILGIAALTCLGWASLRRIAACPRRPLPIHALQILWLILYSVVGGLNGVLGQVGITAFRCTNRASIYILTLALLFAVKALSRATRAWNPHLIAVGSLAVIPLVLWDQLPPRQTVASLARARAASDSDRAFALAMQNAFPVGAMIFQLPVMKFPEAWPINQMGDYEHFRPYLYTSTLHYSYGSNKGRAEDDWQSEVERRPPAEMAAALKATGFAAIYINRKGFTDGGVALIDGLAASGYPNLIESPAHDLACVSLAAVTTPKPAQSLARFTRGWYPEEGNPKGDSWRCSSGDGEVLLQNDSDHDQNVQISFQLVSHSPRTVQLHAGDQLVYQSPPLTPERVSHFLTFRLPPGTTRLWFKTEPPVTFPGNRDTRLLSFVLYNFHVDKDGSEEPKLP